KNTVRLLLAAIKQIEVDRRTTLTEDELLAVLQKEAKSRRESLADAQAAGRADLAADYAADLAQIEAYLPQALTREELVALARAAIAEAGATDLKQLGAVMKTLTPRTKGRADGKLVNEIVRELLA
ncbi:MAG: GatB/YqeY domain-containing protein, partial [Anaerolineales bacterium]|nr:GatB/YqeY domain-containing protein [Anaerolineales bacterium]